MSQQPFEKIGNAFIEYYYQVFDANRSQLGPLYQDNSLLTWEGKQIQGKVNIIKHLEGLPFKKVQHKLTTIDCQPSVSGGVLGLKKKKKKKKSKKNFF